ncbi:MAG: GNAT family N-acetyltransferase [Alphaproteobacteria bacterium]|nr:GNAT family N-acetyltransferase [Alphaproteobacteria bacterium]
MQTRIRPATIADAEAIALVHVVGWRESYRGLVPDRVIDGQSVAGRTATWRRALDAERPATSVMVAELGNAVVGFAAGGPRRGDAFSHDGELYAIYVRRIAQGAGIGRALVCDLAGALAGRGFGTLALWVLRDNLAARQFYIRLGGRVVAERIDDDGPVKLAEVAYGWNDLAALCRRGARPAA